MESCTSNLFKAFHSHVKECLTDLVISLLPRNAGVERVSKPLTVSPLVTSLFVLQRVYDAVQLAEDVGKKINSEFSAIMVEVTDPFKDIWDKSQLDEVYYDARSLPASVTEYLIMNIKLPRRQFRFTPIILD